MYSRLLRKRVTLINKGGEKLSRKEIGDLGERIACVYLKSQGWRVLYRNYRGPRGGEVDIVARHNDTLAFVEVKTRTTRGYGRPLDAVNLEKQELIERGANSWLRLLGRRDMPWRFDVVEIILTEGEPPDVTLVQNAF